MVVTIGCEREPKPEPEQWQAVATDLPGALLSVWGTSASDVWTVGADSRDGQGPTVLHLDGDAWERVSTARSSGDLWWVFGFEDGPIYMGGDGGIILRYEGGTFTEMTTPGTNTVFGIWGASPDDVWAVGGASDATGGFAWRLSGDAWVEEPSVPADVPTQAALWKIFGRSASDAWIVGSNGVALHWNGSALEPGDTGVGSSLFTVHEHDGVYAAVGGSASGYIIENDGSGWANVTPDDPVPMGLSGVTLGPDGSGIAVGLVGGIYVRDASGWHIEDPDLPLRQNLHGSWIDDEGGLWAAGGDTFAPPLTDGLLLRRGIPIPTEGL
ncbi:MAG: hypothetical protein H6712_34775 [Myxococcales bacterium]|nr:hypothetical protein [Myxococcales bacterium]MCB9719062.1 hypothetical protein [Myxococcales bacterium]